MKVVDTLSDTIKLVED